ncbi:zinc finger protein 354C-like [Hippocampus zosterae]|uniref:zinc finger protein 354C-like n=1 Tax=Hippocampus zosterae TaxID=109293 RepID=UPI00223DA62C|nr:zinc finger protein 354C-like [Hippocampus zosterae]
MLTNMTTDNLNLESQLLSIMDVLVKAAVQEIRQLFSESSASLRLHLSQSLRDNESLRMRMKAMRSEIFSLRLQTRTNRPASRFSILRANVTKARSKTPVVLKPPATQQTSPISLHLSVKTSPPDTKEHAVEEIPDVILIKDEEDTGGCEPSESHDTFLNPSVQSEVATGPQNLEPVGSSSLTGSNEELRITSVHGRGQGPLQDEIETLFAPTDQQVFNSQDLTVTQDGFLNVFPSASDRAPLKTSQLDRLPSSQTTILRTADSTGGHPSHIDQFPQQLNAVFPSHTVNKSLDCNFCGMPFPSREDLMAHKAAHTGELHISCAMCGKSFANKTTLGIHMRIHTGEKPYACSLCGKRFTQNGSLKIHLRTHSGEKPYSCSQCTASFNNPSNLRRHMMTHNTNGPL